MLVSLTVRKFSKIMLRFSFCCSPWWPAAGVSIFCFSSCPRCPAKGQLIICFHHSTTIFFLCLASTCFSCRVATWFCWWWKWRSKETIYLKGFSRDSWNYLCITEYPVMTCSNLGGLNMQKPRMFNLSSESTLRSGMRFLWEWTVFSSDSCRWSAPSPLCWCHCEHSSILTSLLLFESWACVIEREKWTYRLCTRELFTWRLPLEFSSV